MQYDMKKPEYILDVEKKLNVILSQITFDCVKHVESIFSIIKLEPSFSISTIDDNFAIIPRENIYITVHGFYLVFGFSSILGTPNELTIFYHQFQNKELSFYINQLKLQIKNATTDNRRIERKD